MLNRQGKKQRRFFRRPSGRTIFILIVILFPLAIIASYIDFPASVAFIRHYFTPPNHFTYHGHTAYISGVVWSPDGKRIASASGDGTVQVWDALNGSHVLTYRGHSSDALSVGWSPDGKYLASGGLDTTVQVWNATTGAHILTYRGHTDAVFAVAWSPDGIRIASASNDGTVQEWEATTGKRIVTISSSPSVKGPLAPWNTVAWSPDGKRIAIGGNGDVQIWDAFTGGHTYTYRGHVDYYPGHYTSGAAVNSLAWSPDGKHIASASSDSTVQVWQPM